MRAIHLIEGWWPGTRSESATDAAASCCAAWMRDRPEDEAIVLGPASAAARVRAMGVRVAASWSSPLGLLGLSQAPLRRLLAELSARRPFAGAVVWTPGAMSIAVGLDLPLTDMTTGTRWSDAEPKPPDRDAARANLCAAIGASPESVYLVGAISDPPGRCDAFLAMYGVALADGAGLFSRLGRRGVLVVPAGAADVDRARGFVAGIGKPAELAAVEAPIPELLCGVDAAMMMPVTSLASHLAHARDWWMRVAERCGIPTIAGPGDRATFRVPAWGKSELGKAMARVLTASPAEAMR